MNIPQALATIGLTSSESAIYRHLLEQGVVSPPEISRAMKMARSNIHYILKSLVEKGLINKQKKGKRFIYAASDPSATLSLLERRKEVLEEVLPDLKALHKKQKTKPVIRFYDGSKEMRAIFEEILETKSKEVFGFASTDKLFALIPDYFETRFQPELKNREIFLKDILAPSSGETVAEKTRAAARPYYEYRVLPKKYESILSDILVWDNNVAILTLEEPTFGTMLTNAQLAHTFKTIFEIIWTSLDTTSRE